MKFKAGDDVLVTFDGNETPGEVLSVNSSGYIMCRILVDPTADYGSLNARLSPVSTVCVREGDLRHALP